MKVFVVNLHRRSDRLAKITEVLRSIDLEFERVPAVDGRELYLKEHIRPWRSWLYEGFCYPLSGAVGCYLSHLKIWQYIVDNNIDQAMVLEDDVSLYRFDKDILGIDLGSYNIDLLRIGIGSRRYEHMIKSDVSISETTICNRSVSYSPIKTSCAYIITNRGAATCSSVGKYWFPVDDYRAWERFYGLRSALIIPPMLIASSPQDSDIDSIRKGIRREMRIVIRRKTRDIMIKVGDLCNKFKGLEPGVLK